MSSERKFFALGAVIILAVGAALYLGLRRPANNEDAPDGTWWVCASNACAHEFNLSLRDLAEYRRKHYGQPVRCGKCRQEARQAEKCRHCQRLFVAQRRSTQCTHCGKTSG